MAEGEEGRSHPCKNGSAWLILTGYSYRCNSTGLSGSHKEAPASLEENTLACVGSVMLRW